jgi:hypothetical protein
LMIFIVLKMKILSCSILRKIKKLQLPARPGLCCNMLRKLKKVTW